MTRIPDSSNTFSLSYDSEADVLYVNYRQSEAATDSELTDDDVIIHYHLDEVIGYTILHASQRESIGGDVDEHTEPHESA